MEFKLLYPKYSGKLSEKSHTSRKVENRPGESHTRWTEISEEVNGSSEQGWRRAVLSSGCKSRILKGVSLRGGLPIVCLYSKSGREHLTYFLSPLENCQLLHASTTARLLQPRKQSLSCNVQVFLTRPTCIKHPVGNKCHLLSSVFLKHVAHHNIVWSCAITEVIKKYNFIFTKLSLYESIPFIKTLMFFDKDI